MRDDSLVQAVRDHACIQFPFYGTADADVIDRDARFRALYEGVADHDSDVMWVVTVIARGASEREELERIDHRQCELEIEAKAISRVSTDGVGVASQFIPYLARLRTLLERAEKLMSEP